MEETWMRRAIERKRDGERLEASTWEMIVRSYMDGAVDDAQMAALAMACVWRGLDLDESVALTRAMLESSAALTFPPDSFVVDKHSSGGVGDIVSLVAVPLVAACGVRVAKISGRALGHTGGTIDKLETIDGFNAMLGMDAFVRQVEGVGCAVTAQTEAFVPADKRLYHLRDRTATVASIGLIGASIVSKKVAGGAHGFVFDVKCGSAAFMRNPHEATELAQTLVDISRAFGRPAHAVVTDMNEPLGRYVGSGLEMIEARDLLRSGSGDQRPTEACLQIATEMLELAGIDEPHQAATQALRSGAGYDKLVQLVSAQGGSVRELESMAVPERSHPVPADRDGHIAQIDAVALGYAARELSSDNRFGGVRLEVRVGDSVKSGDPLAFVYGPHSHVEAVRAAFAIGEGAAAPHPLLYARI
jgi:pyrimidine-nucleoside phosphorylase